MGERISKMLVYVACLLLLAGCAYNQQNIRLQPYLQVPYSSIGKHRPVAVYVIDSRAHAELGSHLFGFGKAALINLDSNLTAMTTRQLELGLARQGFKKVTPGVANDRILNVDIQQFDFFQSLSLLSTKVSLMASFEVTLQNGPDKYTRIYRAEESQYIPFFLENPEETQQINRIYSQLLNQILMDPQLLLALTDEKHLL